MNGRRRMKGLGASIISAFILFTSGCLSPSPEELGPGFYSDRFRQDEVPIALQSGEVMPMGRFSIVTAGCFQYQQASVERNIIIPALRDELDTRGANVADDLLITEPWYSHTLRLLMIPTLMGCSLWELSGEAIRVKHASPVSAMSPREDPLPETASPSDSDADEFR